MVELFDLWPVTNTCPMLIVCFNQIVGGMALFLPKTV